MSETTHGDMGQGDLESMRKLKSAFDDIKLG